MVERAKVRVLSLETRGSFIGYEEHGGLFVCFVFWGEHSGLVHGQVVQMVRVMHQKVGHHLRQNKKRMIEKFYFFFVFSD